MQADPDDRQSCLVSLAVLLMFALTLTLVAVTGDPRFVLAKPAVFTAAAGLYCLATTVFGRPLPHDTARPFAVGDDPDRAVAWERATGHRDGRSAGCQPDQELVDGVPHKFVDRRAGQ